MHGLADISNLVELLPEAAEKPDLSVESRDPLGSTCLRRLATYSSNPYSRFGAVLDGVSQEPPPEVHRVMAQLGTLTVGGAILALRLLLRILINEGKVVGKAEGEIQGTVEKELATLSETVQKMEPGEAAKRIGEVINGLVESGKIDPSTKVASSAGAASAGAALAQVGETAEARLHWAFFQLMRAIKTYRRDTGKLSDVRWDEVK